MMSSKETKAKNSKQSEPKTHIAFLFGLETHAFFSRCSPTSVMLSKQRLEQGKHQSCKLFFFTGLMTSCDPSLTADSRLRTPSWMSFTAPEAILVSSLNLTFSEIWGTVQSDEKKHSFFSLRRPWNTWPVWKVKKNETLSFWSAYVMFCPQGTSQNILGIFIAKLCKPVCIIFHTMETLLTICVSNELLRAFSFSTDKFIFIIITSTDTWPLLATRFDSRAFILWGWRDSLVARGERCHGI